MTIDDAEDLDLAMPRYNLLQYSWNYSETTDSLWFCSKNITTSFNDNIANTNNFRSFVYKVL